MAISRRVLYEGEEVLLDIRPHWIYLIGPLTVTVLVVAAAVTLDIAFVHTSVAAHWVEGIIAAIPCAWLLVRFVRWRMTSLILTNVRVLAIAQNLDEKSGDKADKSTALGSTATLELTPEQAELVVLAERMGGGTGSLRLTLRSMLDASGKTSSVADLGTGKTGGLTIVRAGSPQQASR